ncbi:MAG: hypothetical protein Q9166_003176 [cf. Caloplaca sp. 2 TL-2023]
MSNDQDGQPPASDNYDPKGKNPVRKKQLHEYRIAARREKRLRKADEKKQRKLNATILRRMTRNPDKYNKNAERNRLRDIETERRRIQSAAIKQVQQLAAVHDQSGAMFNIGPVMRRDDGSVVFAESVRRRQERNATKADATTTLGDSTSGLPADRESLPTRNELEPTSSDSRLEAKLNVDPGRMVQMEDLHSSKNQPRPGPAQPQKQPTLQPPPKPVIPDGITLPDGEQDWLALWDLPNEKIERRILRAKKEKAAERKALRIAQQSGKSERREARDEKRKVYRDIKMIWKVIREEHVKERTMLKAVEDEESRKIAVEVNDAERSLALRLCETLGFTITNTPGTEEIKPRALGMRGKEVDFDAIKAGECPGDVETKRSRRVDLGEVARSVDEKYIPTDQDGLALDNAEFIKIDVGEGHDHETLSLNHKLRRKLRRALEHAQIQKEMLVRQRTVDQLKDMGIEPPDELKTGGKARNIRGMGVLENGVMETAKQERVRARVELAEFNYASKVLRRQAKQCAIEAGLRKHARLTGRLPSGDRFIEADKPSVPAHINASATEAKVGAAASKGGQAEADPALERSEEASEESDDNT